METLRFRTTLKCNGCVATVKPGLDSIIGLTKWEVDLESPQKILTVEATTAEPGEEILNIFRKNGFEAERI